MKATLLPPPSDEPCDRFSPLGTYSTLRKLCYGTRFRYAFT